jgi:hypothetical protein
MAIVGGLDIHRRQITYDWVDTDSGQARHGRIQPATRVELRAWLARLAGQQADFAFEGTTGWRYVAEEVMGAGFRAHLAEPADTRALPGPKRRAKTDRADAHHLPARPRPGGRRLLHPRQGRQHPLARPPRLRRRTRLPDITLKRPSVLDFWTSLASNV